MDIIYYVTALSGIATSGLKVWGVGVELWHVGKRITNDIVGGVVLVREFGQYSTNFLGATSLYLRAVKIPTCSILVHISMGSKV